MTNICINDLENSVLNNLLMEELSNDELELIRGGIIPLVALGVASFVAGITLYKTVKD